MIGKKFNRLTVIDKALPGKGGRTYWLCRCDCGKEKRIQGKHLRKENIKSCGCLNKENPHLFKHASKHPRYKGVDDVTKTLVCKFERGARNRNIIFDVSVEYLSECFKNQNGICALTGEKLTLPITNKDFKTANYNASIDRIDSSKGYIEGNIQWVTKMANVIKLDYTMEELIDFCYKVVNHNKRPFSETSEPV
jgi:hypothetical protein